MKLLLDTHILLWAADGSSKLSQKVIDLISNQDNELYFSAASIWEVSIKSGLGRADFQRDAAELRRELLKNGYIELQINGSHAAALTGLSNIHKDPFDRMLLAQSLVEGVALVTADSLIAKYPLNIIKV